MAEEIILHGAMVTLSALLATGSLAGVLLVIKGILDVLYEIREAFRRLTRKNPN